MKKLYYYSVFLFFSFIGFTNYMPVERAFFNPLPEENSFLLGAMNNVKDLNFQYIDTVLKMNLWHFNLKFNS